MTKLNFNLNSQVYIEPGEEELYEKYKATQEKGRRETLIAGVDNGSTQVRTTLVRLADEVSALEKVYVIPSSYTEIANSETIVPGGEELYHKLDSAIVCNIDSDKAMFNSIRAVRGTKSINSIGVVSRLNASNQKVSTPAFYANLIDGLGYSLIMDCQERNMPLAESYDVYLGASLPPDDAGSKVNSKIFKNAVLGTFQWTSVEYGVTITINIKDVKIMTEAEAAVKAYCIMNRIQLPENVLCLEDGGRNSSCAILKEGIIYPPANKTFPHSGSKMVEHVVTEYVNTRGGSAPRPLAMRVALQTGKYKRANLEEDVTDIIKKVKKLHGQQILTSVKEDVFSTQTDIGMDEIGAILFSGRSFGAGEYGYSSSEVIKEAFDSLGTGCIYMSSEGYLIPTGNAIFSLMSFGGHLANNDAEINRLPVDEEYEEDEE